MDKGQAGRVGVATALLVALVGIAAWRLTGPPSAPTVPSGWRVWAVEYGQTATWPKNMLVKGVAKGQTTPLSWMVFVIRGPERTVLVDTGFDDAKEARRRKFVTHQPASQAIAELGLSPDDITDVVLTHLHWDHAGEVGAFARARVWLQQAELDWARRKVSDEQPSRAGIHLADVRAVEALIDTGRVELLRGDAELAPGVVLHAGGGHTAGTQWVSIETGHEPGTIVLAGDNAYLYENLEQGLAIGGAVKPKLNLPAQAAMKALASGEERVVPGHDPLVFDRRGGGTVVEVR